MQLLTTIILFSTFANTKTKPVAPVYYFFQQYSMHVQTWLKSAHGLVPC